MLVEMLTNYTPSLLSFLRILTLGSFSSSNPSSAVTNRSAAMCNQHTQIAMQGYLPQIALWAHSNTCSWSGQMLAIGEDHHQSHSTLMIHSLTANQRGFKLRLQHAIGRVCIVSTYFFYYLVVHIHAYVHKITISSSYT